MRGRRVLCEGDFSKLAHTIERARESYRFLLTAWVFLPNHWHGLVFPRYPLTISEVMKAIKLGSTHEINLQRKESGPLWQSRFFDHAIRAVKEYHDGVSYIHLNPVKRGLSKSPEA